MNELHPPCSWTRRVDDFNGYSYFFVCLYWTCSGLRTNTVEKCVLLSPSWLVYAVALTDSGRGRPCEFDAQVPAVVSRASDSVHRHAFGLPVMPQRRVRTVHTVQRPEIPQCSSWRGS